jgi:hypothetical protein
MKTLVLFFCFFVFSLAGIAQEELRFGSDMEVSSVPNGTFGKQFTSYSFCMSENEDTLFFCGFSAKEERSIISVISPVPSMVNPAKFMSAYWEKNRIYLSTQMPFRVTIILLEFEIKNKGLVFLSEFVDDPNAPLFETYERCLDSGNIACAVDAISGIQYPMSSMNESEEGIRIMKKAHEVALKLFRLKNADSASVVMEAALSFWGNTYIERFPDSISLAKAREESFETLWTDEQIALWIGDYGLFLLQAKKYTECIRINAWLNKVLPSLPGPYLQHADALYYKGEKTKAKSIYNQYKVLMQKAGKKDSIPSRVFQRTK